MMMAGRPTLFALLMTILSSQVMCQGTINGPQSNGNECCGLHLMDSASQHVVIETGASITPATYQAIRLRVCTTDPVLVQLWRRVDDITYEFRWQTQLSPSSTQTTLTYVVIPLSSSITISSSDRLGLYSTGQQLVVPFSVSSSSTLQLSSSIIANPTQQFTAGQQITLDTYHWSRSFQKYVTFCRSSDCSDQAVPTTTVGSSPSDTVVYSSSEQCCDSDVPCSPSLDVNQEVSQQNQRLQDYQDILNSINNKLNSLISASYVSGLCPQGFTSAPYGVGSCYLMFQATVSFAQATQNCRSNGAYLLTIESSVEEQFIKTFVGNNTVLGQNSVIKFWTTGLYNSGSNAWYWYAGTSSKPAILIPITYTRWLNNTSPNPGNSDAKCLILNVDRNANSDYWTNEDCNTIALPYICEASKQCL